MRKTSIIVAILVLLMCDAAYANLTATEGLAIDLSSAGAGTDFTIAFDPTELLGSRTWGDASTDTIVWTWNRATGTDPTITFNSGSIALPALTLTTDLVVTEGGTGASAFTDGGPLLGSDTGAITAMSVLGDGEIIIGDGTTDPVALDIGSSTSITILGTIATGVWQGTAIDNAYVPDDITIDLATLATTLTITDNEDTAENNPLVFVAGAAAEGGDLGLETDGTTHYNPSTGTITATEFVGGGAGLTAVDAATGDNAGSFFDAGTIEHEYGGIEADISAIADGGMLVGTGAGTMGIRASFLTGGAAGFLKHELGGLEADISSYTGLVAITGGSTAEVDAKSELEGHIADVADFAEADGDIYTGAHDFGGVTSLEIPNSDDPDVDAIGEITQDANGAGEANDVSFRAFDSEGNQFMVARKLKTIQCTIIKPNDLADGTRDACPIWSNETGMTFTVWKIEAWSDTDDTVLNVEEEDADGANNASVDELTIATDGTGMYYTTETSITGATIEANHILLLDFDDTDDPGWVKISICGWYNANVD